MRVTSTLSIQAEHGKKSVPIKWRDNEWSPRIVIRPATRRVAACGFGRRELPSALYIQRLRRPARFPKLGRRNFAIPLALMRSRFSRGFSSDSSL